MSEPKELQDFLDMEFEPLKAILSEGLMFEGSRVLLYGQYKSFKSMLAIHFALSAIRGEKWIGFTTPVEGTSVMYLQLELPEPMLQVRIKDMLGRARKTKQKLWLWSEYSLKLDDPVGWERVRGFLSKHRPGVLIIDPVYKVMKGNLLDARQVQDLEDAIDKLIEEFPTMAVMLISHARKSYAGNTAEREAKNSDDMIGSVLWSAWADSIVQVNRNAWGSLTIRFDVVRHAIKEIPSRDYNFSESNLEFTPVLVLPVQANEATV